MIDAVEERGGREPPAARLRRESLRLLVRQRCGEELTAADAARLIRDYGGVDSAFRAAAVDVERRRRRETYPRVTAPSQIPSTGIPSPRIASTVFASVALRIGTLVAALTAAVGISIYAISAGRAQLIEQLRTASDSGWVIVLLVSLTYAARLWGVPVWPPAPLDRVFDVTILAGIMASHALPALATVRGASEQSAGWLATHVVLSLVIVALVGAKERSTARQGASASVAVPS